jgi:hypothetical protein
VYDDSSEWHTVSSSIGTDERVDDLEDVELVAWQERWDALHNGEDVGWSSRAEETVLEAPQGATDEEVMPHLKANYTPDELAKLRVISLFNTQVTDVAVTALAKGCPSLRLIRLDKTQVTPSLAKVWNNDATPEAKHNPDYGGTIADFRWELNRIIKKKKKGKGKKKRR